MRLRPLVHRLRAEGPRAIFRSLARRAQVRWLEWRYGIHTDAVIELAELGIHNDQCKHYGATDYSAFALLLRALAIDPRAHVFLDYGAGMGRAMVLAGTYPFRRVFGVEIAGELTAIARQNFDACRKKLRCGAIEIATEDATKFAIPPDTSVFYFNNPFNGDILAAVLENVRAFAAAAPAPPWIVCNVPPQSAFEEQMRQVAWLRLEKEFPLPAERHALIFRAAP